MASQNFPLNFCSILTLIVIILGVYFIFSSCQKEGYTQEAPKKETFYYNVSSGYDFNPCYTTEKIRGCGKCGN